METTQGGSFACLLIEDDNGPHPPLPTIGSWLLRIRRSKCITSHGRLQAVALFRTTLAALLAISRRPVDC